MPLIDSIKRLLGRPSGQQKWDAHWAKEGYSWLGRLDELAHYSVLAGYALQLKPGGALLDVGCGDGLLRDRLHPAAFSRYVGLDFAEPVARAQSRVDERTAFVVGDMLTHVFETPFDTIVFNESLYYATDVVAELRRYGRWLSPGGVFLVSTHMKEKTVGMWDRILESHDVLDRVTVTNGKGVSWICGAFRVP